MELLTTIARKIGGDAAEWAVLQVGYVINYGSNVENLKTQLKKLVQTKEKMEHSVAEELRKGRKIEAYVKEWQSQVNEIIEEADKLLNDEGQSEIRFYCFYPNFMTRYHLSREATLLVPRIDDKIREEKEFGRLSYSTPPQNKWTTKGYLDFDSRLSIVNDIMAKLTDSEFHIIGIYGMAGVGKTTLAIEIARQATEKKLFDNVAKVEMEENTDLKKIQKAVAEKLGLELDENQDKDTRASRLREYIDGKEILLILDDVRDVLDLETLGLSSGMCKILLTCRDRELASKMGTQKEFQLKVLEENETWSLFENVVGDAVRNDLDIQSVATEVAKRCAGLPVLAVTVANALKGKKLYSWRDALTRLENFDEGEWQKKAYSGIEWSCNQLKDEEMRSLFLVLRMLGGRYHFHGDILKYTMGLHLFKNIKKVEQADDRLHVLVDRLKDSCLLLGTNQEDLFTMHDLVRDVAKSIASGHQPFLSLAYGEEFKEWPCKEDLEKYAMISLRGIDISKLPELLECPELRLLVLSDFAVTKFVQIPCNFLKEMKKLEVLDLSAICMPSLPPSIRFLTNLQTLCLDRCELGDIAVLGELRSLVTLSLLKSKVKQLPKEIGKLTQLQWLDLGNCSKLEVIHPNVISSLTALEILNMNNNFNNWEIEGMHTSERSNASLSELKHLSNLTRLDINIKDASQLPINCFSEKLVNFEISIGDVWNRSYKYSSSRKLKLKLSQTDQLDQGLKTLMKKSEELYLDVLEGVHDIVDQLDMDGFPRLKILHVQNNLEILQIVNCQSSSIAFPNLEALFIRNLVSLESLCSAQLPRGSFEHLTIIQVVKCPKLKNLFSFSTILHFLQLQEIIVVDCNNMKEIVVDEKEENFDAQVNDGIKFFQLRSLTLQSLPELICFTSNNNRNVAEFEKIILNNETVNPTGLFCHKEQVAFPKLVENLTSLIVDGCGGLRFLSSSSMAINFVQLKKLRISRCQNMVEIISTEEYNGIEEKILDNMFPKLEYLELNTLANLETFCSSATYLKFSCLNSLIIMGCTKLGPFILDHMSESIREAAVHYLFDEKVGFPGLEKLVIKGLHKLTTLWHTQLDPNSFCKLTEISVEDCQSLMHVLVPRILKRLESTVKVLNIRNCDSLEAVFNVKETDGALLSPRSALIFSCRNLCEVEIVNCRSLKNVFPASVARNRNLEKLQTLHIENCEMLEQIVGEEVGVEVEAITPKFVFPSVNEVSLLTLPQLSSFYPGMHTSKWPSLTELTVGGCEKLEMLAAESSCFQRQHHQLGMPTYNQVFFLYDKDSFSNLNYLGLELEETSYGSLPVDFFKIKYLFINCQHITSAVTPSVLFRRCHNLEELAVCMGSFEEIFIQEGSLDGEEHQGWTLTHVKTLRIVAWVNLMHVWKGSSHLAGPVFPNLETLEVDDCPRLKNIVSSAISFRNIVDLEVTNCDGMKHLITYSVAKSFINLEKMTVQNCPGMIEIVASDDDEGDIIDGENEITFSRLEYMELSDLPNLKGFCSRNYNVRFPFFMTISVSHCIEIKISFDGVLLDDSKQEKIQIIEDDDDVDDNNDDNRHCGGGGNDHHKNDNEPDDDTDTI